VIEVGAPLRARGPVLGAVALILALALIVLPAVVAIVDPEVLSLARDSGWLGSPITRFAALQTVGMLLPFVLGATAAARDRGRDLGMMAAAIALLANFLLLRVVLAAVVTLVLL
jgi:hypothetical protein